MRKRKGKKTTWLEDAISSPKPVAVAARRRGGAGQHGLHGRRKARADRRSTNHACRQQERD
jgi:hypothetical protein